MPGGIVYAISCDAAGRWGAYCEDFDTMRADELKGWPMAEKLLKIAALADGSKVIRF